MTVNLSFIGGAGWQFFDDNGDPLSGGKIYTYAAGTTTPQATYTSRSGTTANTNPIILDAAGRTPQQVWATEGLLYKYVVKTSTDVLIRTWDNIGNSYVASDLELDLASTVDNTKGDALIGFRQSDTTGFLTGATGRTVNTKLQEIISVKDFGATGDGVTDDTAAIIAAMDAFKGSSIPDPGSGVPNRGPAIYFPRGTYLVTGTIPIYSGAKLYGDGVSTVIQADASLTTTIFRLTNTVNNQCRWVDIGYFYFRASGTCRVIQSDNDQAFLDSTIHDCVYSAGYCIDLTTNSSYTQSVSFIRNTAVSALDQFLSISGNRNTLIRFNKEGSSGSTADPYIYAVDCSGFLMQDNLIEGAGSVNKAAVRLLRSDVTINQFWFEVNPTNGFSIDAEDSSVAFSGQINYIGPTTQKIRGRVNTKFSFTEYSDFGTAQNIFSTLDIDSTCLVQIGSYVGRNLRDVYRLTYLKNGFSVGTSRATGAGIVANGYIPRSTLRYIGSNVLVNPSFEAGVYGWTTTSGPTIFVQPSEISTGQMLRLTYPAATVARLQQNVTINAAQIGVPFTFTGMVRTLSGTSTAWSSATCSGAGLVPSGSDGFIGGATVGEGWQMVSQTITPLAAGTLTVGFVFFNVTEVMVDAASFGYGLEGEPDRSRFGSLDLNAATFTTASVVPTTGTWKVGDRIFNSAPAVGQPKSWVCTVAGSPGTWVSEGNL